MNDSATERHTGLLQDKTFQAIYNAFQLGWSLYELKSRVLLASFDLELQALQNAASQPPQPANPNPLLAFIDDLFKQARPVNAPPLPSDDPTLLDNDKPLLPEAASENDWLRSVWRALFKQIAELHVKCKLEQSGENDQANSALYGYPSTEEAKKNYPYLYFQYDNIEYPQLGMPTTVDGNMVDEKIFSLPNLVYRALNCLTLLYTDPQETLSPETVKASQRKLLDAFNPSLDDLSASKLLEKLLSGFLAKLLVTWDNYVREHLYYGGMIKNDEMELVAYEAGRSMGSLPWGISVRTVVLEKMLPSKSASAADAQTTELYKQKLNTVWQDVFDQRNIVHIQHQISALGQAMDDAYYNVIPGAQRPGANKSNDTVAGDAQLPTRSIYAIRHSLDYWLRSIQWLAQPDVQQVIRAGDNPTGKQSILTRDLARDLRVALIQQSDVWHSLMTYEQNLGDFTAEYVTLNILNDFMVKLEQAIKKRASADLPILIVIGAFALIALIAIVISVVFKQSSGTQPAIIAFIVAALAAGGRVAMSWVTSLRGIFGASGQTISDVLQKGYQQLLVEFADLNYNVAISSALVAFFIEDADVLWKKPEQGQSGLQVVVNDAYSFLTEIIWTAQDRAEEIDRVAVAAFGPLGALVGEQLDSSGQAGGKKKPQAGGTQSPPAGS
jgi:hypothetical protein